MSAKWTDRVRAKLKAKQMKQIDLATALGVSESMVSQYLKGTKGPSVKVFRNMAKVLDMSLSELMGDDARFYSNERQIRAADLMKEIPEDKQEIALKLLESLKESTQG